MSPELWELRGTSRLAASNARIRTEEECLAKLRLQKKGLMHDLLTGRIRVGA